MESSLAARINRIEALSEILLAMCRICPPLKTWTRAEVMRTYNLNGVKKRRFMMVALICSETDACARSSDSIVISQRNPHLVTSVLTFTLHFNGILLFVDKFDIKSELNSSTIEDNNIVPQITYPQGFERANGLSSDIPVRAIFVTVLHTNDRTIVKEDICKPHKLTLIITFTS